MARPAMRSADDERPSEVPAAIGGGKAGLLARHAPPAERPGSDLAAPPPRQGTGQQMRLVEAAGA
jgi:hypothetical protein